MQFQSIWLLLIAIGLSSSALASPQRIPRQAQASADVSAEEVRNAIEKGKAYLLDQQKGNGRWKDLENFTDGTTGLATLALLNAKVSPDSPAMKAALQALQKRKAVDLKTYALSLRIMALAQADPTGRTYLGRIKEDVDQLIRSQLTEGRYAGGWGYSAQHMLSADASNSQFAILALHEASLLGIDIDEQVWLRAKGYWKSLHRNNSGFVYNAGGSTRVTGSMTCAGISSWLVINENLADPNDYLNGGQVACCGEDVDLQVIREAIRWLSRNFTVSFNPPARGVRNAGAKMYYLYGMERAGRLSGERFFGNHDWYREGAAHLVSQQKRDGSWRHAGGHSETMGEISTSFALLFLAKGKRPVVFGKYQHSTNNDWDRHPKGIQYLTRQIEIDWRRDDDESDAKLNWQTVRGVDATVDDLLEAPILFFSGRDKLQLTPQQEENLKKYIENGGFIFAEACQGDGCGDNVAFDRSFRELVKRLFPDSELSPLPPDHPIWTASHQLKSPDPNWPVLGVQACCRTSIVYVPRNLTGYWRLNRKNLLNKFPARVVKQIEYCSQLGVNVASYATGRQLDDKGDRPKIADVIDFKMLAGRNLHFPKLSHSGGSDDAPNAWRKLQNEVQTATGLRIKVEKKMISPIKEQLAEHPFVFMHGRGDFRFSADERKAIKRYLELGGFIFADSICSSPEFTDAFRREFNQIFNDLELTPLPKDHPLFNDDRFGWPLHQGVILRKPDTTAPNGVRERVVLPQLEALEVEGRIAVIFSPYDISCALENATITQCEGYSREDAIKIGTNVILYRLQSD